MHSFQLINYDIVINMKIVIASNNIHKISEYRDLFSGTDIEVMSMDEVGISVNPNETGATYEENATVKAEAIARLTNHIVIADDSGLEIKALNDLPGLNSARFAAERGGSKSANQAILKMMHNVSDRSARFVCVIALSNFDEKTIVFRGECHGTITNQEIGEQGFGYDPIFFSIEAHQPFAQLSKKEKNLYSHRSKAVSKLIQHFLNNKVR